MYSLIFSLKLYYLCPVLVVYFRLAFYIIWYILLLSTDTISLALVFCFVIFRKEFNCYFSQSILFIIGFCLRDSVVCRSVISKPATYLLFISLQQHLQSCCINPQKATFQSHFFHLLSSICIHAPISRGEPAHICN